jgi:DNA-binding CsgD family transcriptional regulator
MTLFQQLLRALSRYPPSRRLFRFDDELVQSLQALAEREQRSEEDIATDLLSHALAQRSVTEAYIQVWQSLSRREQQVVALTCLDCTNRQIAARLMISPETVKTHIRSALRKFGIGSKQELRRVLTDWDFSEWGED